MAEGREGRTGALSVAGEEGGFAFVCWETAKGGRFRFSSRCALLAQRDALGVHASLGAEPSALRLGCGSGAGGVLDVC
ncbi:MAG: hypothetical protein LBT22_01540, partial [Peptococcaceae bacterium]|nr:hypothetical protein [Peptococcaceae bacterium]